jgi:dihydrofolate reductase
MRRVVYSVAMSLDGFIAGPNGEFDWIPHDPDIDFKELFSRFDAMVMGRGTWETMQKMGGGPDMGMESVVISRTLRPTDVAQAGLFADPASAIETLRGKPGKDIWLFGGGVLFRTMLDAGLVDGVQVAVAPILLGEGLPMLPHGPGRATLTLTSQRHYPGSGIVLLTYDVTRDRTGDRGQTPN